MKEQNLKSFNRYKRRVIIGMIIAVIIVGLFAFVMAKLIQVNSSCVNDPFVYAAGTIVDKNRDLIYSLCSCQINDQYFYFDHKGKYREDPRFSEINNFSSLSNSNLSIN